MIWQFLVAAAIGIGLIQLGAMSVWVTVLAFALKGGLALLVTAALFIAGLYLWRRYKHRGPRQLK